MREQKQHQGGGKQAKKMGRGQVLKNLYLPQHIIGPGQWSVNEKQHMDED